MLNQLSHRFADYPAEGLSTGKNFGSARMKFGSNRLFTLQIYLRRTFFFGTRAKIFSVV